MALKKTTGERMRMAVLAEGGKNGGRGEVKVKARQMKGRGRAKTGHWAKGGRFI